jgi:hypothetical protein
MGSTPLKNGGHLTKHLYQERFPKGLKNYREVAEICTIVRIYSKVRRNLIEEKFVPNK